MRGKASDSYIFGAAARITPAYAGKRSTLVKTIKLLLNHPCVCGEKVIPRVH